VRNLTKRQFVTYAVVSQSVYGSRDILTGLLPFFEPIISKMKNQIFDPDKFLREARHNYPWPINKDVVFELIPRMQHVGWLDEIGSTKQHAVYRCKDISSPLISDSEMAEAESNLKSIGQEFLNFVEQISPLSKVSKPAEYFEDLILNWLVDVEGYEKENILAAAQHEGDKNIITDTDYGQLSL